MKSKTTIYFVRHGRVHNPRAVFYGRLPGFGLDEQGRAQARRAGLALRGRNLAAIISSPLLRARQTALGLLAGHPALKLQLSGLLTEVCSCHEGEPQAVVNARKDDIYTGAGPEFEQPADIVARAFKFMQRMRRQHPGGHVAAVTHGDIIVFMILWAAGRALTAENKLRLSRIRVLDGYPATGSITSFTFSTQAFDELPAVRYVQPA